MDTINREKLELIAEEDLLKIKFYQLGDKIVLKVYNGFIQFIYTGGS